MLIILASIWFVLWGVLWAVYFLLDGFDLGAAMLLPFVGKNPKQRGTVLQALGPVWNGNEVWLMTAGGAMFAAFPKGYATLFSFFYSPLMLVLVALIIRGVSIEFRYHPGSARWEKLWESLAMLSSLVVALGLGMLFANIFVGIPMNETGPVVDGYHFIHTYSLVGGLFFIGLFLVQGGLFLTLKLPNDMMEQSKKATGISFIFLLIVSVIFLAMTFIKTKLFANYLASPMLLIVVAILLIVLLGTGISILQKKWGLGFIMSSLTILFVAVFAFGGLYPNLLPSSISPEYALSVGNASSSIMTLSIMLGVALFFVPIVIAYQAWTYFIFRHRVVAGK